MGLFITIVLAGLAVAFASQQQSGPRKQDNPVEELRDIEQRLAEAWVKGDREFISNLLAEEWSVIDAAGRILVKRRVMQEAFESKERHIESLKVDEVAVRMFSGCAVVTGRTRATGRYQGNSVSITLRFTDVFVRRDGKWQVVASQATQLSP